MKTETKLKIINLVKRLIKLKDKPIQPFIIEERKVEIARFYRIYDKDEFDWLKEKKALERIISLSIAEKISKTKNAIQYEESNAPEFGANKIRVEAFLLFVVPKYANDVNLTQLANSKK